MNVRHTELGAVSSGANGAVSDQNLAKIHIARLLRVSGKGIQQFCGHNLTPVRSAFVADIGFIDAFHIEHSTIAVLSSALIDSKIVLSAASLEYTKAQRLREFVGDLDKQGLYLLEFPGGYLLSYNDALLSFTAQ